MTKRYLSLFLALFLVLPLFGCTGYTGFDRAPESVMEEPQAPVEETLPLADFLDSVESEQVRIMYERLYALYDYETFDDRSPIPQRFQSIYPDKFSVGTIQSAGCGISSLSMVASYLFDEEITPDMMLKYDYGDKPATAMEAGIRDMQLNCEIYYGTAALENLDKALEEGRPVIALHQKGSRFTKAGHFLVMAGKNPDGTYIVNDPNMENYYNPRLVDGFTNGFSREDVTAGLVGIYIFDRKDTFTDLRETSLTA